MDALLIEDSDEAVELAYRARPVRDVDETAREVDGHIREFDPRALRCSA